MTRIAIIGGGFLGSALATSASERGWYVTVIGRSDPYSLRDTHPRCGHLRFVLAEAADALPEVLRGEPDAVIVAAGGRFPVPSASEPVADAIGTLSLLITVCEGVRTLGPAIPIVLLSSAGAVYSPASGPLRESMLAQPTSAYGMSRFVSEQYMEYYRRVHGLSTCSLRCTNVYGRLLPVTRGQGVVSAAFWSALTGRPFTLSGDGHQIRDFLYVDDFAQATLDLLACGANLTGIVNVGSGTGYSVAEVVHRVAEVTRSPISINTKPGALTDLGMLVVDISLLRTMIDFQPRHPADGIELMARSLKPDQLPDPAEAARSRLRR